MMKNKEEELKQKEEIFEKIVKWEEREPNYYFLVICSIFLGFQFAGLFWDIDTQFYIGICGFVIFFGLFIISHHKRKVYWRRVK